MFPDFTDRHHQQRPLKIRQRSTDFITYKTTLFIDAAFAAVCRQPSRAHRLLSAGFALNRYQLCDDNQVFVCAKTICSTAVSTAPVWYCSTIPMIIQHRCWHTPDHALVSLHSGYSNTERRSWYLTSTVPCQRKPATVKIW